MDHRDGKSMDDVLASIRKIVRSEKEAGVANRAGHGPDGRDGRHPEGEEPLVLTPEMRVDGWGEAGWGEAGGAPAAGLAAGESGVASAPGTATDDAEALRAALRALLREELSGGPAEQAVRGIVRDELTNGQVGSNISQNVLRLIRDEVAKAVQAAR